MADNTQLNAMSGGDTVATKELSGRKVAQGLTGFLNAGGTDVVNVSAADPLPVYFPTAQPVSDGGGSLTVDGTVEVSGPVAVTGSFWQATQPVSIASLPLPSGAATSAKQPALGTAGSASADVLTVQGVASMTAIKVDGSAVTQPVSLASSPLPAGAATEATLSTISGNALTIAGKDFATQATLASLNGKVAACNTGAVVLAAGTALIGVVAAPPQTGAIYSGTTALTPKYAAISAASSGNNTIVAAVASKKIRVLSYRFQGDADVAAKFRDNTAGVDLTGAMSTGARGGGGGGAAASPFGHFETASGNALSLNLSAAVQVSGHLCYVEV